MGDPRIRLDCTISWMKYTHMKHTNKHNDNNNHPDNNYVTKICDGQKMKTQSLIVDLVAQGSGEPVVDIW